MADNRFSLDNVLMSFDWRGENLPWTVRNAVEGVQIFGGIGSGKTSGSGRMLALKYLANGFGGLVLTVKPDERQLWEEYCQLTGRTKDLIVVQPDGQEAFNFLRYEIDSATGSVLSNSANVLQVLKTVIRASSEKDTGKSDDAFWETALDMLISNTIELCLLAYESISVNNLYYIAQNAPSATGAPPEGEARNDNPYQQAYNAARYKVTKLKMESGAELPEQIPEYRAFMLVKEFFEGFYRNLSDKTRSVVDFSFCGFLYGLMREPVYSLFCDKDSTFTPDDSLNGKIILIDLPVKMYHRVGRDTQIMFKYIWQRAMEKRRVDSNSRPVFLWADEAQHFLHEHDAEYQATARSSKIATVYISQNLPNYYASMGGVHSEHRVKGFLGTLSTKIFHANADIETNKYASELIGEGKGEDISESTATTGKDITHTKTKTIRYEKIVRPEVFGTLPTGGRARNFKVGAYIHIQGATTSGGLNSLRIDFDQQFTSPQTSII
jgi:hypothetical protein